MEFFYPAGPSAALRMTGGLGSLCKLKSWWFGFVMHRVAILVEFFYSSIYYCVMKFFYVYILSSKAGVLYVGVTNDIKRRVYEHKNHIFGGFTDKYEVGALVYFETKRNGTSAIKREKQIKGWIREKKVKLIDTINPDWEDLSRDWND